MCCAFILAAWCGCVPRGDTADPQQALARARYGYREAVDALKQPVRLADVSAVADKIEEMLSRDQVDPAYADILDLAGKLSTLLPHAGYPGRPALAEAIRECRGLAALPRTYQGTIRAQDKDRLVVMAIRIYNLLSAEVRGSAFQL